MRGAGLRHALALAFVLALLAGCSAIGIGYRNADTFLAWRADTYFDLDADQKRELRRRLDRLLRWHRYEQLPDYAAFLGQTIDKASTGLRRDDIIWFVEGMKKRYRVIIERGAGDAADMLLTITPAQIAALQRQWERDNREFVRDFKLDGTPAQRRSAAFERTIKQIEDWTGNLTEQQEQKIRPLLDAMPLVNHLRHQDRIRRQREFVELLALRGDPSKFRARLREWLLDWESGRAPEYEKALTESFEKRITFYIAVEKILTPAQRENVLRRADDLINEMKALSARPS
jgi:hypothetical protein